MNDHGGYHIHYAPSWRDKLRYVWEDTLFMAIHPRDWLCDKGVWVCDLHKDWYRDAKLEKLIRDHLSASTVNFLIGMGGTTTVLKTEYVQLASSEERRELEEAGFVRMMGEGLERQTVSIEKLGYQVIDYLADSCDDTTFDPGVW